MSTEPRANLNQLATEIAIQEGLSFGVGVAQVKEILALLGIRWRNMPLEDAMVEINCLISRGGKLSEHKKQAVKLAEQYVNYDTVCELKEKLIENLQLTTLEEEDPIRKEWETSINSFISEVLDTGPSFEQQADGSFVLSFQNMLSVNIDGREVPVCSDKSRIQEQLQLRTSIPLEGLVDSHEIFSIGADFVMNFWLPIIFSNEKKESMFSDLFKIKSISKMVFTADKHSSFISPRMNITVYGKF